MGMKTVMPSTPEDAKGLMKAAIREDDPVMIFAPAALLANKGPVPDGDYVTPLGRARIAREGNDITIVALGPLVPDALKCAETLATMGVSAEVIDPRSLLPLDHDTLLSSVRKTGRIVASDNFEPDLRVCGGDFCGRRR